MTKKEIIIKAWLDLNIETPFGICNNTGFYFGYFVNGVDDIIESFGLKIEQIEYDIDSYGIGKFRPITISGIEHNKGWNSIVSTKDLPKEIGVYYFYQKQNNTADEISVVNFTPEFLAEKYTHWKKKEELEYPLY